MAEAEQIARGERPITADRLAQDLLSLGVGQGDVLIVHASLAPWAGSMADRSR